MSALDELRDAIPDAARDLKLNLQSVLAESSLSPAQRWGTAVAAAVASRNPLLRNAMLTEARTAIERGGGRRRHRRRRADGDEQRLLPLPPPHRARRLRGASRPGCA